MPRVRRRRAKPHDLATNVSTAPDALTLSHSPVLVTAPISPSVPRTFISDPSAARKVTVLSVHPISSAPISESSRVEATRSGPFQKPNYHGCVYVPMALNWLRVVGSLLRWRRMVGVIRRKDWSDDWHGQFGKFQGARLLWFNIALCSLQFRTLLAFRVAFQRFAHTSMKRTVLICGECYTPTKKLNWYCQMAPFCCLWHPDYQHPLCSTYADLGYYCKKFCSSCACSRSFYPAENNSYHVMAENPILLHPDYNGSVRHIEKAVIANAHLIVDQQDKRYRGACAESTGISPSRAHDLGIRSSHPCVRRDVSDVVPSAPDVRTQKLSPPLLPMGYWKSILTETGYTVDDVENAMSINGGDFVKSFAWLRDHCVRDHSDESDDGDDTTDSYGDGVAFDDVFDY